MLSPVNKNEKDIRFRRELDVHGKKGTVSSLLCNNNPHAIKGGCEEFIADSRPVVFFFRDDFFFSR